MFLWISQVSRKWQVLFVALSFLFWFCFFSTINKKKKITWVLYLYKMASEEVGCQLNCTPHRNLSIADICILSRGKATQQYNSQNHRISCVQKIHKDHRVQCRAPCRNSQIPNPISDSSDQVLHELWQLGSSTALHVPCSDCPQSVWMGVCSTGWSIGPKSWGQWSRIPDQNPWCS